MQKCDEVFFKEIIEDGRDYRRMMRRWESNANSLYGHWTMMPRWPNASKSPPPLTPVHNNHSNNSNNNNKPHHRHEKQWCVPNSILVDWLVEVHLKFKLIPETLHVTVNLIDRYLLEEKYPAQNYSLSVSLLFSSHLSMKKFTHPNFTTLCIFVTRHIPKMKFSRWKRQCWELSNIKLLYPVRMNFLYAT